MGVDIFVENATGHLRGIYIDGMWQIPECVATQELSAPDVLRTSNGNLCCVNCKEAMDDLPRYTPLEDFNLIEFVDTYRTERGLPRNGWQ